MISIFDLLVLSSIPGVGSGRLRMLISRFETIEDLSSASPKEISGIDGFSKNLALQVTHFLKGSLRDEAQKNAEQQLSRINKIGGKIIPWWDHSYPDLLKKIYDPPAYLYIHGEFAESDAYAIAIVGTRSPTAYGIAMTERFGYEIALKGITVVSGLARGIDTIAHQSALKAGGRTIAVIGSGLDRMYPPENKSLAERIVEQGAVISEFPMGAKPDAVNFPKRNRIVSGLSLGTLVIESAIDGGALITATTALDQNREVFAVPGNINSKRSHGVNHLIKNGRAKLVESFEDIAAELQVKLRPILQAIPGERPKPLPDMTLFEQSIYNLLNEQPRQIDSISEESSLSISDTLVNLLNLEFKGLVKQLPGKMFIRN